MSMTESENIQATFEDAMYCVKTWSGEGHCEECRMYPLCHTFCDDTARIIVNALEEIQQYRAIGTVSEFRELKEKAKNPIDNFEFSPCPKCGSRKSLGDGFCYVCGTERGL
jgi:sulfatase maturation enzyme AslB (radical SAM superfamily)